MEQKKVKYILDSNILIDILKGKQESIALLKTLNEKGEIFCSAITKFEIYSGMSEEDKDKTLLLLDKIKHIDVNDDIAKKAGEYFKKYHRSYGIDVADSIISATANLHAFLLVTNNIRHFPMSDIECYKK